MIHYTYTLQYLRGAALTADDVIALTKTLRQKGFRKVQIHLNETDLTTQWQIEGDTQDTHAQHMLVRDAIILTLSERYPGILLNSKWHEYWNAAMLGHRLSQ